MGKRNRRSTIGSNNPLDSVVPRASSTEVPEPASTSDRQTPNVSGAKERLTVHLPKPLIDRVKNAVYWTPGLTLASLGQRALEAEIDRMEQERGEPYPQRPEELRGGRPMK